MGSRTVLVTAIGGGGFGDQILKALLLAARYRIVGADIDPQTPQLATVDQAVTLPPATHPEYADAVVAVCARFEVEAVLPGSEPELLFWSRHRELLAERGLLALMASSEVIETGLDKRRTGQFLRDAGFAHPRWAEVDADADLGGIDWFPVVVKPATGAGGSRDTYLAQDARDLALVAELISRSGAPMMVQEYVGCPDSEYTVGVLHDLDGGFVNSIAVRRRLRGGLSVRLSVANRTGRAALGEYLVISSGISQGLVGRFPEVTGPCERMAEALGVRGAVNFQCRLVDGEVMVFEINPRFSGTTSIRAVVGYNEPDWLLRRHLLGEEPGRRFPYREGLVLRTLREVEPPKDPPLSWREL